MATLIKVDRNGTKTYEGLVDCPRCGGYAIRKKLRDGSSTAKHTAINRCRT